MHFIYGYFSLKLQNRTNCELTLCILIAFGQVFCCQYDQAKTHVSSVFIYKKQTMK